MSTVLQKNNKIYFLTEQNRSALRAHCFIGRNNIVTIKTTTEKGDSTDFLRKDIQSGIKIPAPRAF